MAEEQASAVTPQLYVESVEKSRDFYIRQLGFGHMMGMVGKDGNLDFAIVIRDGAMVMFSRPDVRVEGASEKYRLWFYQTVKDFASVTPPAGVKVV